MAAVVQVKRRLDEEPLNALVLNCKKRKLTEASNDDTSLSTVLEFAGTINEKEHILTHIKKHSLTDLKEQYKKHPVNISDKLRAEKVHETKENRFKVVSCFRSQDVQTDNDSELTVFEIEKDADIDKTTVESSSKIKPESPGEPKYVYDLYYTNSDDLGDADLEDYISIHPLSENLMYGSMRDNGINDRDSNDDSEDSNAENNWRNDYPDESDMDDSIQEEDIIKAMKNVNIKDELSSDDGEEGFVYSIDSEAAGFEEDIDDTDVRRYGEMYARFKARNKTTTTDTNFYYGDIDEDEYYY